MIVGRAIRGQFSFFSVCIHVCIFGGDEIECYLSIQGMYGYIEKSISVENKN